MESTYLSDEAMKTILSDMRNRVFSMSLVHSMLYRAKDLSRICAAEYFTELSSILLRNFPALAGRVSFGIDIPADLTFLINAAVPCGMALNELLTNSLKYAFPGDRKGVISITARKLGGGRIAISLADDGIGFCPASIFAGTAEWVSGTQPSSSNSSSKAILASTHPRVFPG